MAERRPPGRPTKLDQVIRVREDGTRQTVHDVIVQSLRAGNYVEAAAATAGITKQSVYQWMNDGADANARKLREPSWTPRKYLRLAMAFSDAVDEAVGQAEAEAVILLEQLARGGRKVETRTVKTVGGAQVEEVVRTETLEPNAAVIMWRLERRFSERWGRRQQLEVSGTPGGEPIPVDVRVDRMVEALERARAASGESPPADR